MIAHTLEEMELDKPYKKVLVKVEEEDRAILLPLPDDPVEHFCGIFKNGPSLTKALLTERKKVRGREEKKGCWIALPCSPI